MHVAAGENWHELVCHSLQQGWFGLENLALIPGTVGAAPVQNIGAYGVELASVCAYVEAFNWQSGQLERIEAAACGFGYRDSIFKHACQDSHFITAVGLRLAKAWQPVAGYGPLAALGSSPRRRPSSTPSAPPAWPSCRIRPCSAMPAASSRTPW